ncbi:hypothetical protein VNO78_16534 [Psophocarpus tetragonolobus]|uniref:Uncharacterized protein n=1 Tax=Psophocarpus tetragonolobus TaxID=3891 RepID=A0AAN9XKQ7_PSOTE
MLIKNSPQVSASLGPNGQVEIEDSQNAHDVGVDSFMERNVVFADWADLHWNFLPLRSLVQLQDVPVVEAGARVGLNGMGSCGVSESDVDK